MWVPATRWFTEKRLSCSALPSVACDKWQDQKQSGEKGVYFILQLIVHHDRKSGQSLQAETWKQELKQRPRRALPTGLLFMVYLGSFFLPRTNCPGWHCPIVLSPPTSIINQENAPHTFSQAILREAFYQLWFLFSDGSNLFQVDGNLTRTLEKINLFVILARKCN